MTCLSDVTGVWINSKGVDIEQERRDEWGYEIAKEMLESREPFIYQMSGNSIVVAVRIGGEIELFDCVIKRKMRFEENNE